MRKMMEQELLSQEDANEIIRRLRMVGRRRAQERKLRRTMTNVKNHGHGQEDSDGEARREDKFVSLREFQQLVRDVRKDLATASDNLNVEKTVMPQKQAWKQQKKKQLQLSEEEEDMEFYRTMAKQHLQEEVSKRKQNNGDEQSYATTSIRLSSMEDEDENEEEMKKDNQLSSRSGAPELPLTGTTLELESEEPYEPELAPQQEVQDFVNPTKPDTSPEQGQRRRKRTNLSYTSSLLVRTRRKQGNSKKKGFQF